MANLLWLRKPNTYNQMPLPNSVGGGGSDNQQGGGDKSGRFAQMQKKSTWSALKISKITMVNAYMSDVSSSMLELLFFIEFY